MILKGLTEKRLSHHGKYFTFEDVPMEMQPVQRPYPPLWYGANSLESADRLAKQACNTVVGLKAEGVGQFAARYRAAWQALGRDETGAAADRAQPPRCRGRHRQGSAERRQARLRTMVRCPDPSLARPWRRPAAPDDPRRIRAGVRGRLHHCGIALDGARAAEARQRRLLASITASAGWPSATSRSRNRSARSSCSPAR